MKVPKQEEAPNLSKESGRMALQTDAAQHPNELKQQRTMKILEVERTRESQREQQCGRHGQPHARYTRPVSLRRKHRVRSSNRTHCRPGRQYSSIVNTRSARQENTSWPRGASARPVNRPAPQQFLEPVKTAYGRHLSRPVGVRIQAAGRANRTVAVTKAEEPRRRISKVCGQSTTTTA